MSAWAFQFLIAYAVVLIVPGPNTIAVAGQAAVGGLRSAVPLACGIAFGAFALFAAAYVVTGWLSAGGGWRWLSCAALLFVAWRIARAGRQVASFHEARLQFGAGLVTALFNPVTLAFFVAHLLGGEPRVGWELLTVGGVIPVLALANACAVAALVSRPWLRARITAHRRWIADGAAVCLALLALKSALL